MFRPAWTGGTTSHRKSNEESAMSDDTREAEMAAALVALRQALLTGSGPDETVDSSTLRDLVSGRLDASRADALYEQLDLPSDVRSRLAELQVSSQARDMARRHVIGGPMPGVDPLGVTVPPTYHLDGPHGGRKPDGIGAEVIFDPGDRVELIARPAGPVSRTPDLSLWVGKTGGALGRVEDAVVQRDVSGVYRVLAPAEALFDSPGRWRIMIVLGDEDMQPRRAETTESLVQVLRARVTYRIT